MQIYGNQLDAQLKRGLPPMFLLFGDEPLLVEEGRDRIRAAARAAGFEGRELRTVEAGFDWNDLFVESQSLSLFSERRVVDLRLPSGKPGETGARILSEIAAAPPADTVWIISCGKLDKDQRKAKWIKSVDGAGVVVAYYPVDRAQLPAWVSRRMKEAGLNAEPGVAETLAYHFEGNLLACSQEIEKLALTFGAERVQLDALKQSIDSAARFTVFGLTDLCLEGETRNVPRVLAGLRSEGVEPVLVLWALVRELRLLVALNAALSQGEPASVIFERYRVWDKRRPLIQRAMARARPGEWRAWLMRAARLDRVIKGRAVGDPWLGLECLAMGMAGKRLATCR